VTEQAAATTPHGKSALDVQPASPDRILIVRLGAMGDVIHGLPAVAALRAAFPEVKMSWLIEERWAELLCTLSAPRSGPRSPQRPLVDRIHTVNTRQWRSSPLSFQTWERIAAILSDLRTERYDVAIDLQGAVRSSLLAKWSGAGATYGFAQPRENLATMFYSRRVIASGGHVVEQNIALAEAFAGRTLPSASSELPHDNVAEQECELWLRDRGISHFAVLNPGAGWGAKQWPAERYGQVAKSLAAQGVKPVVNVGPGEESMARAVEDASGSATETFKGSLTQLIALTRRADLFIGGDTGPMHLAAALKVPVVAIFGPTDPARNGPFGTRSIVLRSPASSTSYKHVAQPDDGLLEISVDQVVSAASRLLKERHG
jgi:heptosyltransferase I